MTPQAQRIAIAEACGWTCCGHVHEKPPHGLHPSRNINSYSTTHVLAGDVPIEDLPDYLNDLNAMHEAEKVLSDEQKELYARLLHNSSRTLNLAAWHCTFATASQRAEAFLRTLNLWDDSK